MRNLKEIYFSAINNKTYSDYKIIIYISYNTIISIEDNREHYININKYSQTTSKHLNAIKKSFYTEEKTEKEINKIFIDKIINLLAIQNTDEDYKSKLEQIKNEKVQVLINEIDFFKNIDKFLLNYKINTNLKEKETKTKINKI